ncbi:VOC family protein [Candidatus Bipolaricaulota bacterium]|nr:VOC family protein [Candidatus Bipolaricaulota bacterium]
MNIEHVGIYAHDSEALAKWYTDALGLREVRRIDRGEGKPAVVFLQGASGAIVEILPTSAMETERALNSPGFTHLGIAVDNMDEQMVRLAEQGIEVKNIRSTSNGWTIGYFNDPEGNILELVQR